ncbi:hypothetical protein PV327_007786 [Microctonus hyperodae]|uniref:allantoinase n=1 Tax=Microctonus hyperodae TaxID=165561 RepID=A0AA39FZX6_MICHY|nr:hypothetical protein PV327_007786 [Microctonus hyperodae]
MSSTSRMDDDEERHYVNPYEDYTTLNSMDIIDHTTNYIYKYAIETLSERIQILLSQLVDNRREWINRDDSSIYTGNSGIAHMFYLLYQRFNDPSYMTRAVELLERLENTKSSMRDITFLTGEAGRLALSAVIYHSMNNQSKSLSMISKLKVLFKYAITHSYDELLYGRVGYLYALLYVNKNISPPPIDDEWIKQLIACILSSGREYSMAKSYKTPLMYRWHEKEYLGGAHGLAGILYILLQAREFLTKQQLRDDIEPSIKYLQSLRFPSGNFPSSIGNTSDKLVHWCHGAPSMTMLFSLAYQVYGDESFLETAKDCGEVVWARGLLKKGCGICHGVAGNAYTFLCLYQITKEPKYLYRTCKFAEWCFEYEKRQNRIPDRPYSLFEGLAGGSMSLTFQAFASQRTVLENEILPAIVIVANGKIVDVVRGRIDEKITDVKRKYSGIILEDFGSSVLMPGLVDSHVHVNEPGRTHWEGFYTATKAAAAGGVTTIVDMPLNSIPPTTSVENLEEKMSVANENIYVDVAFWGGVIPGNTGQLKDMVKAGVVGFKCFLCPSGIDEFPHVSLKNVEEALKELSTTDSVLAFHAELEENVSTNGMDPTLYETFLHARPPSMEVSAVKAIALLCQKSKVRCHIVHLSASDALDIVSKAKKNSAPLTAETCHHYLTLSADEIPKSATHFKCCPPIRTSENQDKLWDALKDGTLDMVVSDHSPCTLDLKKGDFLNSWGGISSLQFGLPLIWTQAQSRGININDVARLISTNPAKLCGLDDSKGKIRRGMDADFVVWDPEKEIIVNKSDILYKNKISPYEGKLLKGRVLCTILRGNFIYKNGDICNRLLGKLLTNKCVKHMRREY